jgi:hypothetical protein
MEAGGFKYVGVAACSMCHRGATKGSIYEVWLASPHARAFENLGAENQKNEVCLRCHTTGYGKPPAALQVELSPAYFRSTMRRVSLRPFHSMRQK